MPRRVLRKDAEILRNEFNCNAVRCSHYPQSEAFLDACDELGLLVWEEIPGWQYIGDASWQDLAVRDVSQMVQRDRNHPSVIIWGVRINESHNDPALYHRTKKRQSCSMTLAPLRAAWFTIPRITGCRTYSLTTIIIRDLTGASAWSLPFLEFHSFFGSCGAVQLRSPRIQ